MSDIKFLYILYTTIDSPLKQYSLIEDEGYELVATVRGRGQLSRFTHMPLHLITLVVGYWWTLLTLAVGYWWTLLTLAVGYWWTLLMLAVGYWWTLLMLVVGYF